MQASSIWAPPTGTLGGIVAEAIQRAELLGAQRAALELAANAAPLPRPFAAALRTRAVAIIAEGKRRAPSKGWIKPGMAVAEQAAAYEAGGAAVISVLTEPAHFGGSNDDLLAVQRAVRIPTLKKDFHVDPIQLLEARALGASAALLIVRALSPVALMEMMDAARALDLEVLVEVRDSVELQRALDCGAAVVGINNRNLETLVIDPTNAERLLAQIPGGVIAVAESGMSTRGDIERIARAGADAVLVGSAISAAENPAAAVRTMADVMRIDRDA